VEDSPVMPSQTVRVLVKIRYNSKLYSYYRVNN